MKQMKNKIEEEKQLAQVDDGIALLSEVAKEQEKLSHKDRFETKLSIIDDVAKFKDGDRGGFAEGDVIVISAPTGNGKTLLAATISHHFIRQAVPVLWFSYEVPAHSLWQIFQEMGLDKNDINYIPLKHTTGKLEWIETKIKEAKKFDIKLVVIDHLGFLAPFQMMNQNMSQNYSAYLAQIVRELKTIAMNENVVIILPAHMNKSATDEPTLRDIGHSGGIAQEADMVILLAREENQATNLGMPSDYYSPYTKIKIAKNRISGKTPSGWLIKKDGKLVTIIKTEQNENPI